MRNESNIDIHELIGLDIFVIKSTNPLQRGIRGRIVDETKNTIVIDTGEGRKIIMKKGATFRVMLGNKEVEINGNSINYRPQERIKKILRRRRR